MRIAIAAVQTPFIEGGAEFLSRELLAALRRAGHTADIVTMPFKWYPAERIPEHILAARLLDVTGSAGNDIDLVIGTKFPAFYFRHPNKVLWIYHQHKAAYELEDLAHNPFVGEPRGLEVREAVVRADNLYLPEARKVFTISKTVASRLYRNNRIVGTNLYPPPPDLARLRCEGYEDFVFYPSRINGAKRQSLVIEAMAQVRAPVQLFIAGQFETDADRTATLALISRLGLEHRVRVLEFLSQEDKLALFARCRAAIFTPYEEDLGFVTMEAFFSAKPVITCRDSGGPLEFVLHGQTGLVCEPDTADLAAAIDTYGESAALAREHGQNALALIRSLDISWDNIVRELTTP